MGSEYSKGGTKIKKKIKMRPDDEHGDKNNDMYINGKKKRRGSFDYDKYEGIAGDDEHMSGFGRFKLGMDRQNS